MAISFSGLASGMDTSSWVEALVSVKQSEMTKLESNRSTVAAAQETLNNIKSYFSSFQGLLENITDAKFGIASRDLFTQNLAESSNVSVLTATASTSAENTTYNIEVKQLASATEVNSGLDIVVPHSQTNVATMNSTLFSIADEDHNIIAGDITFSVDNNLRTISIDNKTTISDFINLLDGIGISAGYDENSGIFSLGATVEKPQSRQLKVNDETATGTTQLKDLGLKDEQCSFSVTNDDGSVSNISLTKESTLNDLFNALNEKNISASIDSNGVITLSSTNVSGNLISALGLTPASRYIKSDTTGAIAALGLEDVNYGYKTETVTVNIVTTTTVTGTATLDLKLKDLFVDANKCDFDIVDKDGTITHIADEFTTESTLGDVLNRLEDFGITATLNKDGSLSLTSDKNGNVFKGNLAQALRFEEVEEPYISLSKHTSTDIVHSTVETVVSRDSTLGQIGAFQGNGFIAEAHHTDDATVNATMTHVAGLSDFSGGDTFAVSTVDDLVNLAELVNSGVDTTDKTFVMGGDIDVSAWCEANSATGGWNPIGIDYSNRFKGTFDGNGHKISGVKIDREGTNYQGVFGLTIGELKNIGVEEVDIKGGNVTGGLAGYAGSAITNSYATGNVTGGELTGGLVGSASGAITNSYATGDVTGGDWTGGLIGQLNKPSGTLNLDKISSSGTVTSSTGNRTGSLIGGIVNTYDGTSFSTINITNASARESDEYDMIGFEGKQDGTAYSSGQMEGWLNNITGIKPLVIRECDGGEAIATISSLTTSSSVQDLFNALTAYGITGSINDGVIQLNSTSGNFIDGNIATNIGILQPVIDTYYTTASTAMTSSTTFNTDTTLGALGMSSDGSVIIDSPIYGIVSVNIAKELTVQQFCNKINDSNYGVYAQIVDNKVQITELSNSGSFVKSMSTVLQNALKLSVGEGNSYNSTAHNVYTNTDSNYIKYDDTGVEINGDTVISSIGNYRHGNGQILLHQNGAVSTIMVDQTLTLEEFINNPIVGLAQYGITGQVLSDGKAYLTSDGDLYLEEIAGGSNILSALKMSDLQQTVSGQHVKGIENLQYTLTVTTTVAATKETALNTWNTYKWNDDSTSLVPDQMAEGSLVFKVNDYYKTIDITNKDTFESLINKLDGIGIKASMSRGVFYIESGYDNVEFVENESSSSLASLIGLNTTSQNLGSYSASSAPVKSTVTTENSERISAANYADMNTKLSTMNISSGKLTVYENGRKADINLDENWTFSNLQSELSSKFSDLRVSFEDGYLKIYSDNANSNISIGATSDKTNFVAITGIHSVQGNEQSSSRQLYKMSDKDALNDEEFLRGYKGVSKDFTLKSAGVTAGNVTLVRGSESKNLVISENETFESLQAKINDLFDDLKIDFDSNNCLKEGRLSVYSTTSDSVNIAFNDVSGSNIVSILELDSPSTNGKISSKEIKFQDLMSGSFKVGDADIYVQTDDHGNITTSIADIVSQINASDKSLATAYWDSIDGKLVIKSSLTGASAINIESGSSILTDVLGLTKGDNLVMNSQSIGKNAILTINGASYTSLSNNVTSDSTGITGLTINLKGLTEGSAVQLTVKRDTETLKNAVQNVVDGYNELITNIDSVIAKDGKLKNQSLLKLIRNNIRTAMTSSDSGTSVFKNLSSIGIKASDAAAGNISTSNSAITLLSLDADEFLKAFESDEEAVKALLIGSNDASGAVINKGIFTKVEELIESALTAGSGYFATANNAYNSEKENISQKIIKGTAAIEKYRARLEKKFSAMDIMIAGMQNQFQSFLS